MSCSCNKLIKPDELCYICAHKHISTANIINLSIKDPINENNSLVLGQLILGSWHIYSNINLYNEINYLIDQLIELNSIDLDPIQYKLWNKVINKELISGQQVNILELRNSIKLISSSYALYNLELGYRSINRSYVIGLLNIASQSITNIKLQNLCRKIWNSISNKIECDEDFKYLQFELWKEVINE